MFRITSETESIINFFSEQADRKKNRNENETNNGDEPVSCYRSVEKQITSSDSQLIPVHFPS